MKQRYGETLEQIEAQVRPALQKFMGNVPVRVVPLGEDQEAYLDADSEFVAQCLSANRALCER